MVFPLILTEKGNLSENLETPHHMNVESFESMHGFKQIKVCVWLRCLDVLPV